MAKGGSHLVLSVLLKVHQEVVISGDWGRVWVWFTSEGLKQEKK